jgi:hypothetical protein
LLSYFHPLFILIPGILKARFHALRDGISLHGLQACDDTYLLCVALHNMILDADGEESSNEDEDGEDTDDEPPKNVDISPGLSAFTDENGVIYVHKLSLPYFREKLIEHHSIQHKLNQLRWPSTNGLPAPANIIAHS